jgi:2-amino-4-hydroxy-6-hydroxymethyldihydropteridine diphosphokinase
MPGTRVRKKRGIAYLCLGSNMGDRAENISNAIRMLRKLLRFQRISPRYDTAPVGNTNQPRFLNLVCRVTTGFSPFDLLKFVKDIEKKMGRKPGPSNFPRPIDIDILFYDDLVMDTPELTIPHPRLTERAFVLAPLADIAPELKHPVSGKTIKQLLNELKREAGDAVRTGEVYV